MAETEVGLHALLRSLEGSSLTIVILKVGLATESAGLSAR
jgi:hypothetical protein